MNSNAHRRNDSQQSFGRSWKQTFGTSLAMPRSNKWVILSLAIVSLLGTGAAMAAWQVSDSTAQSKLEEIKGNIGRDGGTVTGQLKEIKNRIGDNGTVNDHLKDLNRKLQITPRNGEGSQTPEMIATPTGDEALNASQPTTTNTAMDQLCPAGAVTTLGQQQQQLCMAAAQTELAQYRFSMRMFERAQKNYDRLKQIEDRRRNLAAEDYANVQYNTNELLALTALMDNDRDRYRTYMSAYEARIAHINNTREALTRNALNGKGSINVPGVPGIGGN
ncbi:hypothetical protein [Stenotrophomonas sp.]|uniref:hypothetical protein n=1 Tax=Stenotrophomonas sp. TaxID=69392 RepID=UPI002D21F651|nr:hypothetical protein [Stenotrophomonas sp.]HYQ22404.1 hypothetical protein [Stenotrophomonas sp.]